MFHLGSYLPDEPTLNLQCEMINNFYLRKEIHKKNMVNTQYHESVKLRV